MGPANKRKRQERRGILRELPDEERRAGIVRLLAEACRARLVKEGRLKSVGDSKSESPVLDAGYDFLN